MKGRIVLIGIGVAFAAAVLLLLAQIGIPVDFAIGWILLAACVGILSRQAFIDEAFTWPPVQRVVRLRGSEVSRLAWSLNTRTGTAGHVMIRRLERVVRRRLAHRGLNLDEQADLAEIDALLGVDVRRVLALKETSIAEIERVLDAVDRLSPPTEEN